MPTSGFRPDAFRPLDDLPALIPVPQIAHADVRGLVNLLDQLLREQPMTGLARQNLSAIHERLRGIAKDGPPSVGIAAGAWLRIVMDWIRMPDTEAREAMVRHYWRLAPHDPEAFRGLVSRTEERSGDVVRRAAHDANRRAARRAADAQILVADILEALASMPREAGLGETRETRNTPILIG